MNCWIRVQDNKSAYFLFCVLSKASLSDPKQTCHANEGRSAHLDSMSSPPLQVGVNYGGMTEWGKVMICNVRDDIFGQRLLNNPIKDVSSGSQSTVRVALVQLWSRLDLTRLTRARTRAVTAHHMLFCDLVGLAASEKADSVRRDKHNFTGIGCKCGNAGWKDGLQRVVSSSQVLLSRVIGSTSPLSTLTRGLGLCFS